MDVTEIQQFISNHPCFAKLSKQNLADISSHVTTRYLNPNDTLVREGEVVDSIYFIVSGSLVVKRKVESQDVIVAALGKGEVVGLNDSGFYSDTGVRTATVVASTSSVVLRLDLNVFYKLATESPQIDKVMRDQASMMLKMNLIKHADPFHKISISKLRELADNLSEVSLPAGQVIFNAGEMGDCCYLIRSGRVEIFSTDDQGNEAQVAILKASAMFGESALLLNAPRNASARTVTPVTLLKMSRDVFAHALTDESAIAASLMRLMKSRIRPRRAAGIEEHAHRSEEGEMVVTLKNPALNQYYRLSPAGSLLWRHLDGVHTMRDLTMEFYNESGVFQPVVISEFVCDLMREGFVESYFQDNSERTARVPIASKLILMLRNIFEKQVAFGDSDHWVTKTYQQFAKRLFSKTAQIILIIMACLGGMIFIAGLHEHVLLFKSVHHTGWLIVAASMLGMAFAVFHELAHAYTTKFFGRMVKCFGVGWYWLGPIAYCDTSDMWLNSRRERLMVDLAGIYCDIIIAGFLAMLALIMSTPSLVLLCWLLSVFLYLSVLANLDPMMELDGYYALMDWSGIDNLREAAIKWLVKDAKQDCRSLSGIMKNNVFIIYWALCLLFLMTNAAISYFIMSLLLLGFLGYSSIIVSLLAPVFMVVISGVSIISEIKQ